VLVCNTVHVSDLSISQSVCLISVGMGVIRACSWPSFPSFFLFDCSPESFFHFDCPSPGEPVEAGSKHLVTVNGNSSVVMVFVLSTRSSHIRDES